MWSPTWVEAPRATRRAAPRQPRRWWKGILRKFYEVYIEEDTGIFLSVDFPIPREIGDVITSLWIFVAMLEGVTGTYPQRILLFHVMPCLDDCVLCTVAVMLLYLFARGPPTVKQEGTVPMKRSIRMEIRTGMSPVANVQQGIARHQE